MQNGSAGPKPSFQKLAQAASTSGEPYWAIHTPVVEPSDSDGGTLHCGPAHCGAPSEPMYSDHASWCMSSTASSWCSYSRSSRPRISPRYPSS